MTSDEQQLLEEVVEEVLKRFPKEGLDHKVQDFEREMYFKRQSEQELSGNNNMVNRKYKSGDKNVIGPNTQIDSNPILGDNSGNTNNSGNKINSANNNTVNSNTVFFYHQELSGNNNMVDRKYKSGDKNVIGPNTQIDGNPILGDNSGNTNNIGNKIREVESKIEVPICETEQSEVMGKNEDWRSVKDLMNYCEDSRQQDVYLAGFAEDEKSFEVVKSMEEYFSEDKYSKADEECLLNEKSSDAFIFEVVTDEECLLNEESSDEECLLNEEISDAFIFEVVTDEECLLNEESSDAFIFEVVTDEECLLNEENSDAFIFEVVTTQGEFLVEEGEEIHSEALEGISDKLKQRDGDSSKSQTMYQFKELPNKKDKEIVISDNQEKVVSCTKQESKDDRAAVTIKVQQSKGKSNLQSEDLLDRETELMKVSQRKTSARKQRSRL